MLLLTNFEMPSKWKTYLYGKLFVKWGLSWANIIFLLCFYGEFYYGWLIKNEGFRTHSIWCRYSEKKNSLKKVYQMCDLAVFISLKKREWATDKPNRCWIISACGIVVMRQCLDAIIWKVLDLYLYKLI